MAYSNVEALLHPTTILKKAQQDAEEKKQQLARHTDELIKQSQQRYEAETAVTGVDLLIQGLSTVKTVHGAFKKDPTSEAKEKEKTYQSLETYKANYKPKEGEKLTWEDHLKAYLGYRNEVKNLDKDAAKYNELIAPLAGEDPNAYDFFKNLHGSKLASTKGFLAGKLSAEAPVLWDRTYNYKYQEGDDPSLKQEAERVRAEFKALNGDIKLEEAYMRNWIKGKLGDELLHEGLMQTHVIKNVNTWLSSSTIRRQAVARDFIIGKNEVEASREIGFTVDNDDPSVGAQNINKLFNNVIADVIGEPGEYENIEFTANGGTLPQRGFIEGITRDMSKHEIARQVVFNKLNDLTNVAFLDSKELAHLNTKGAIDAPMGNQISKFLGEEKWAQLQANARKADLQKTKYAFINRERDWAASVAEIQEKNMDPKNYNAKEIEDTISTLKSQGAPSKFYEPLELMLENNQSDTELQRLEEEWKPIIAAGFTEKNIEKKIKAIPHVKFRKQMETLYAGMSAEKESLGFTESLTSGNKQKINFDGKSKTLGLTGEFQGEAKKIEIKLNRLGNKLFSKGYQDGLRGNDLQVFVDQELEREWLSNGGGTISKGKGEGGIYAKTARGRFINYINHTRKLVDIKREGRQKDSPKNRDIWDKQLVNAKNNTEEGTWESIKTIPGAVQDAEDFAAMAANGFYSAELKYKAAKLKIAPGTLYELQLQALLGSDDPEDQELVARYNLGEVEVNPAEVELFRALGPNSLEARALKNQGIDNVSPKVIERINAIAQIAKQSSESLEKGEAITGVQGFEEIVPDLKTQAKQKAKRQADGFPADYTEQQKQDLVKQITENPEELERYVGAPFYEYLKTLINQ